MAMRKAAERPGELNAADIAVLETVDVEIAREAVARWRKAHNVGAPVEVRSLTDREA